MATPNGVVLCLEELVSKAGHLRTQTWLCPLPLLLLLLLLLLACAASTGSPPNQSAM